MTSYVSPIHAVVAQSVERGTVNPKVIGSIPIDGAKTLSSVR